jgi:hypothetical protein
MKKTIFISFQKIYNFFQSMFFWEKLTILLAFLNIVWLFIQIKKFLSFSNKLDGHISISFDNEQILRRGCIAFLLLVSLVIIVKFKHNMKTLLLQAFLQCIILSMYYNWSVWSLKVFEDSEFSYETRDFLITLFLYGAKWWDILIFSSCIFIFFCQVKWLLLISKKLFIINKRL